MIKIDLQLQDTTVTCSECGQEFTFSAGEQQSYARRGQSKPSRCAFCRAARMIAGGVRTLSGSSSEHSVRSDGSAAGAASTRCTRRSATNAENKPKSPSSPAGIAPFTALLVIRISARRAAAMTALGATALGAAALAAAAVLATAGRNLLNVQRHLAGIAYVAWTLHPHFDKHRRTGSR